MTHINLVGISGEALKWEDGTPVRYKQQENSGFDFAGIGQKLECRKCKGKFNKILTKSQLCKRCYRMKDIVRSK